uniref:Putative tRNA/rRNA methyltransferase HI_0424 n=1 Tax=Lygus hesperus TaxID=30085 RepID=A0A0A9Z1Z8_LYGHE
MNSIGEDGKHVLFLLHNIGKQRNVGNMIRSAVAFGSDGIVVVGARKFPRFGNQNTTEYLRILHYDTFDEAVEDCHRHMYQIVGVEIGPTSRSVLESTVFHDRTVFMFGNEGTG